MTTKLISYQTKPAAADRNAELSADVFREAVEVAPDGVSYLVLRGPDNTFYHLVSYDSEADNEKLTSLASFELFAADGAARRVAPPVVVEVEIVNPHFVDPQSARVRL